jgi:pilus assembly protein Flp/PilA
MGKTERLEHAADAAGGLAAYSDAARFDLKRLFGVRLLFGDRQAATAIEYSLIAAGIALVIITAVDTVGQQVTAVFTQVATMV